MNFNYEDIVRALNEGTSEQEIAATFTKAMNDAIAAKAKKDAEEKAAKEAAEKAERAAKEAADAKLADAEQVSAAINAFLDAYYPDMTHTTAKDVITTYDSIAALAKSVEELLGAFEKPADKIASKFKRHPRGHVENLDPIQRFLREEGLL